MSQHIKFLASLIIGSALIQPCYADSLIGNVIQAQYFFPDADTPYPASDVSVNPFTVGAGVETIISIEDVTFLSVDFSANTLLITLNTILSDPTWSAGSQNGPAFAVVSGNPFPSISTVVASNAGPVSAFLSSGTLFVNWAGMTYNSGDTVTVTFAPSAVPLPAALPLFAGGLVAMAWLGRRKRRATVPN